MASIPMGGTLRRVHKLWTEGAVESLGDARLIERFLARGDASAFEALVERHGPMVLATCRAILRDPADVDDAFQAVFLILFRRAQTIRGREALGPWLHRVAYRVAIGARADAARRRDVERAAPGRAGAARAPEAAADDSLAALHEELSRLPDRLRLPMVLCHLEGQTQAQAAARLRWGEATVRRRLADARELLRARLTRRGLAPAAVVAALGASARAGASLPEGLAASTASAILGAPGLAPGVSALADAASRSTVGRLGRLAVATVLVGALAAGLTLARTGIQPPEPPRPPEPPKAQAPPPAPAVANARPSETPDDPIVFRGRVTDEAGDPVAGATITYILRPPGRIETQTATTGDDGRFRLVAKPADARATETPSRPGRSLLAASKPGHGFAMLNPVLGDENAFRLVPDAPIRARVIDLEGRPVAGARVRLVGLYVGDPARLGDLLEAFVGIQDNNRFYEALRTHEFDSMILGDYSGDPYPAVIPEATTDADGRATIHGVGRDRLASLAIDRPGLQSDLVLVATRPAEPVRVLSVPPAQRPYYSNAMDDLSVYGSTFDHVLAPGRAVAGVVRDERGGPLAGVPVFVQKRSMLELESGSRFRAVTDTEGRYRIEGLPESGSRTSVVAEPPPDMPYPGVERPIELSRGDGPMIVDLNLVRGAWVTGRVTDAATGKPVELLSDGIQHFVFIDNPNVRDRPERPRPSHVGTKPDGTYRIIAFPGPGLIVAQNINGPYVRGFGADKVRHGMDRETQNFATFPYYLSPLNGSTFAEIDAPAGTESIALDLVLEPGRSVEGRIVDADGQPLEGAIGFYMRDPLTGYDRPEADRFTVEHLVPGDPPRRILARHDGRNLIGSAEVAADSPAPVVLKLQPWGSVTGRLVDEDGRPRGGPGVEIGLVRNNGLVDHLRSDDRIHYNHHPVGPDGRFRLDALLPGDEYGLSLSGVDLVDREGYKRVIRSKPGEVIDLGDLAVKSP